jgi:hypothetical protein
VSGGQVSGGQVSERLSADYRKQKKNIEPKEKKEKKSGFYVFLTRNGT